jgi:hypothetical protein
VAHGLAEVRDTRLEKGIPQRKLPEVSDRGLGHSDEASGRLLLGTVWYKVVAEVKQRPGEGLHHPGYGHQLRRDQPPALFQSEVTQQHGDLASQAATRGRHGHKGKRSRDPPKAAGETFPVGKFAGYKEKREAGEAREEREPNERAVPQAGFCSLRFGG